MKILLTADLHFRLHWFSWLIKEGAGYDLVCIAGDLLDMFRSESRLERACEVKRLLQELADIRMILCWEPIQGTPSGVG